jgi:hypothetical protein
VDIGRQIELQSNHLQHIEDRHKTNWFGIRQRRDGDYDIWAKQDGLAHTCSHADLSKYRHACEILRIPVYFFFSTVYDVEDAQLLEPSDIV